MFVDIGIAVIVLIGFFVGIARGIFKSLLKTVSIVGAVLLTAYLAGAVSTFVMSNDALSSIILGEGYSLRALYSGIDLDYSSSVTLNAIYSPVMERINEMGVIVNSSGVVVAQEQLLTVAMALHSGLLIVSLMVYFVIRIFIMIIAFIIKKIAGNREKSAASRFFGAIIGAVNGAIVAVMLLLIASVAVPVKNITQPVISQADDSKTVSVVLEPVSGFVNGALVSDEVLEQAFEKMGYTVA